MPVNAIHTRFWYQYGDLIHTSDFNMIPGDIMVTAGLSLTVGRRGASGRDRKRKLGERGRGKLRRVV